MSAATRASRAEIDLLRLQADAIHLHLLTQLEALLGRAHPLLTTAFQGNGPRIDLGLRLTWSDVGWGVIGGVAALVAGGTIALLLQAVFTAFLLRSISAVPPCVPMLEAQRHCRA